MAPKKHSVDEQIPLAINDLLMSDQNITASAVGKRIGVPTSTITRNADRRQKIEDGAVRQHELRTLLEKAAKQSREDLIRDLEERNRELARCERQNKILLASHKALLLAVGEIGGVAQWARFFDGYQRLRDELARIGAIAESNVIELKLVSKGDD